MRMAEYVENEAMEAEGLAFEKIKAVNPQIVVSGEPDKPYYNISYYDITKKEWYIAYGSYCLEYVYKWLLECFEEVDSDMVEVVRCKDCKYAKYMMPIQNGGGFLMGDCTLRKEDDIVVMAWGDNFCSYGERREDV